MPKGIYLRTEEMNRKNREGHIGKHHTDKTREKMRLSHLNPSDKIKRNLRNLYLNKNFEERFGKEKAKETRRKMKETRLKRKQKLGYLNSPKTRRNMSKAQKERFKNGMLNKTREKLSKNHKGKVPWNKGRHLSEKHKRKMRIAMFEYLKKFCGVVWPRIGHNEKRILDRLEQELNHKILRQYEVEGYFVDGYIPELGVVIEVDEKPKNTEKDIERQKIIENKLGCKFIRINDFD